MVREQWSDWNGPCRGAFFSSRNGYQDLLVRHSSALWPSRASLTVQILQTQMFGRRCHSHSCCSSHKIADHNRATHFVFVTPHCDVNLNGQGEIRIDSKSVEPVTVESTFTEPWLWKALAIGISLDIEVVRRVRAASDLQLAKFWKKEMGLWFERGYEINEEREQTDASHLIGLPNLDTTDRFRFIVKPKELKPFSRKTAYRPHSRELYQKPLVLVQQSPRHDRSKGLALLSFDDIAFNESYYGFSAHGAVDGEQLVRYLHLFFHSSLWMYYALLTSPQMGAERRKLRKSDLDEYFIIPWNCVTHEQRRIITALSQRLTKEDMSVFDDIDAFFAELYGLTKRDSEVIHDTLDVAMPFKESREAACAIPTTKQQEAFCTRLESALRPFFRKLDQEVRTEVWKGAPRTSPYSILLLGTANAIPKIPAELFEKEHLTACQPNWSQSHHSRSQGWFDRRHTKSVALLDSIAC